MNDDDEAMNDDTSASAESAIGNKSKKGIIHSLLFGLIPGNVPPELIGLTTVEISMIASHGFKRAWKSILRKQNAKNVS